VTQGAKLCFAGIWSPHLVILGACAVTAGGCADSAASPSYDPDTRLVRRIDYDADRDGRIEARVYFLDGRAVRLEADTDAMDGRSLGTVWRWGRRRWAPSQRDGCRHLGDAGTGQRIDVEISTGAGDHRREFHENGVLVAPTRHEPRWPCRSRCDSIYLRDAADSTFQPDGRRRSRVAPRTARRTLRVTRGCAPQYECLP
jgi:hypothetical protein